MAVKNTLIAQKGVSKPIEYQSNGETVKLSPDMIKKYLVSGNGKVTNEEVMMFLSLCRYQHLNPFLREAYLIKYSNNTPATMVVGKDVFLKRARRQKDFAGLQSGIIVENSDTGEYIEREGTFSGEAETIVGGWAKIYVKGYEVPFYASVSMDEYIGKKSDGKVNSQWASKPATMIRKVALSQALKEAFPEEIAGLNTQEEISEVSGIVLDETPVSETEPDTPPEVEKEVFETPETTDDVSGTLFGG